MNITLVTRKYSLLYIKYYISSSIGQFDDDIKIRLQSLVSTSSDSAVTVTILTGVISSSYYNALVVTDNLYLLSSSKIIISTILKNKPLND